MLAVQAPLPHQRVALAGGSGALTRRSAASSGLAANATDTLCTASSRLAARSYTSRAPSSKITVNAGDRLRSNISSWKVARSGCWYSSRVRGSNRTRYGRCSGSGLRASTTPVRSVAITRSRSSIMYLNRVRRLTCSSTFIAASSPQRALLGCGGMVGAWRRRVVQRADESWVAPQVLAFLDDAGGRRGTERVVLAAGTVDVHGAGDDRRVPVPAVAELHPLVERVAFPSKRLTGHRSSDPARGGSWDLREVLAGILVSPQPWGSASPVLTAAL